MQVYKSQWQTLEDMDVVLVTHSYGKVPYIVWYYMPTTSFVLYPLTGHGIGKEQVWSLDDPGIDWEYLWNIFDEAVYSQVHIAWPSNNFKENLEFYLSNIQ